jgi:hypothetical protein
MVKTVDIRKATSRMRITAMGSLSLRLKPRLIFPLPSGMGVISDGLWVAGKLISNSSR